MSIKFLAFAAGIVVASAALAQPTQLEVANAWAGATPGKADNGAAYVTIPSPPADQLAPTAPPPTARNCPPGGSRRFLLTAAVLAGLVILGAGAFLTLALGDNPRGGAGTALAGAIGGPFQLVDQDDKTVTDADLKGK